LLVLCLSTGVSINNEGKFNGVLKLIVSVGTYMYLQKVIETLKITWRCRFLRKCYSLKCSRHVPLSWNLKKPIIVFIHLYLIHISMSYSSKANNL